MENPKYMKRPTAALFFHAGKSLLSGMTIYWIERGSLSSSHMNSVCHEWCVYIYIYRIGGQGMPKIHPKIHQHFRNRPMNWGEPLFSGVCVCVHVYAYIPPLLDTRNRPKDKTSWWFPPIPNPFDMFCLSIELTILPLLWTWTSWKSHEITNPLCYVFLVQSPGLKKSCQTLNVTNFVVPLVPLVWPMPIPSSQSLISFRGWFLLHSPPQIIAMFEIDG